MHKYLLIVIFFLATGTLKAQDKRPIHDILDSLQYTQELPKDILKTKSMVLVDVPPKSTDPYIRGNWKALAEAAQPGFRKAGIDAVVYYHMDDIYSGKESFDAFMGNFNGREIENVVFLTQENGMIKLILSKVHDETHLIVPGQAAWKAENADMKDLMTNLYRIAANSSQDRENLLVTTVPEFGEMPRVIKARRGEYYDLNFSSEKLAIPMFADTVAISQAMINYPYEYGFVDPEREEKKLRSDGYQYILYYVHSTAKSVKEMLEYPIKESETAFISEVIVDDKTRTTSNNINTPVYKFYIKHIYSGNVFLGKRWDAAPRWQDALINYVDNLRNELVRN
ncbi:hypothetical protein LVD15_06240 [Fulvivirga maritima]|uniref:hypothetical protein n=1 Tax=Fulvivirga maritima TaxID=2904247 RepID=UPI001F43D3E2|nr:hypothetical protein [Fulvivirga maritima]UII28021.1 hypothetical protein LVD15_06240 [Fulvivirga maritima]